MTEPKRRPGRPATGVTPSRSIRLGAVYDQAFKLAERRGEKLPAVIEQALREYVDKYGPKETEMNAVVTAEHILSFYEKIIHDVDDEQPALVLDGNRVDIVSEQMARERGYRILVHGEDFHYVYPDPTAVTRAEARSYAAGLTASLTAA